jgi:hypothetical protein
MLSAPVSADWSFDRGTLTELHLSWDYQVDHANGVDRRQSAPAGINPLE